MSEYRMICPFCAEDDFDAIGLIAHLDQWCDKATAARDSWREDEMRRCNAAVLARQAREKDEALVALADAADKCGEAPHYIVQPFLNIYRRHGETIAEVRAALSKQEPK